MPGRRGCGVVSRKGKNTIGSAVWAFYLLRSRFKRGPDCDLRGSAWQGHTGPKAISAVFFLINLCAFSAPICDRVSIT